MRSKIVLIVLICFCTIAYAQSKGQKSTSNHSVKVALPIGDMTIYPLADNAARVRIAKEVPTQYQELVYTNSHKEPVKEKCYLLLDILNLKIKDSPILKHHLLGHWAYIEDCHFDWETVFKKHPEFKYTTWRYSHCTRSGRAVFVYEGDEDIPLNNLLVHYDRDQNPFDEGELFDCTSVSVPLDFKLPHAVAKLTA